MPLAQRLFGASADLVAFGGSSFGGICALAAAMRFSGRPEAVGGLLVESPSLWVAEGRFLREVAAFRGPWPRRLFVGMGSAEFSGTRPPPARPEIDAYMVRGADDLVAALRAAGLGPERLQYCREEGGRHHEGDWGRRLPRALAFLGQGWRAAAAEGAQS